MSNLMDIDQNVSHDFLKWFEKHGGHLNPSVGITEFPEMGRGAIALRDIEKDSTLFTIPRDTLLSTRTSTLRKQLGERDWLALGTGWQPLIVAMMWEESKGIDSRWSGYLADLPEEFDTLMFWSEEELDMLQGSTVRGKIGKDDVEADYHQKVLPILQRRGDIFDPTLLDTTFSLRRYHINGSRILSRSFHVEEWTPETNEDEGTADNNSDHGDVDDASEVPHVTVDNDSPFVVDRQPETGEEEEEEEDEDEDEDSEKVDHVAMVPMADILNARYGCNNAKLFHEKDVLRMVSTELIPAGSQIWNTYGDPPNSDLLRQYGHVDLIPCQEKADITENFAFENPADDVEIRADTVLDICLPTLDAPGKLKKADEWLSLGGDDTFVISKEDIVSKPMLGFIKFISMDENELQETITKEKLPKAKPTGEILRKALEVLRFRLGQYPNTIQEDEAFLKNFPGPRTRQFNATFVRLCEKRLLTQAINHGEKILKTEEPAALSKPKRPREKEAKASEPARKKPRR
ncbi:SET domain-containing protein [Serendipita vermifera]|nr:SET domain-containing protein [Serendipita vermifera]